MSELTAEDVLSTARRAGWQVSAERAAQIAATAAPRITAFEALRASLGFEYDGADFARALLETRAPGGN
ncbi:MAG: hypothetical protein JNM79_17280 [Burkholderiales bacterium]|nr:hypothetical protein [Burkholderiales bacterium]